MNHLATDKRIAVVAAEFSKKLEPAMEAGLTNHVWTIEELILLMTES